jgi:hypothetical protein
LCSALAADELSRNKTIDDASSAILLSAVAIGLRGLGPASCRKLGDKSGDVSPRGAKASTVQLGGEKHPALAVTHPAEDGARMNEVPVGLPRE